MTIEYKDYGHRIDILSPQGSFGKKLRGSIWIDQDIQLSLNGLISIHELERIFSKMKELQDEMEK
jgi:hypothetical protein